MLERENAPGRTTKEAIAPHLDARLDRDWGAMDFVMMQVLTGHGCFGSYLRAMQKRPSPECLDCMEGYPDSVGHVLFECAAWMVPRIEFREALGREQTLRDIIGTITVDGNKWKVFAQYVGEVMRRKFQAERARELENARQERRDADSEREDWEEETEENTQMELVRRRRPEGRMAREEEEESEGEVRRDRPRERQTP